MKLSTVYVRFLLELLTPRSLVMMCLKQFLNGIM